MNKYFENDIFTNTNFFCFLNLITDNNYYRIIVSDKDLNVIYSSNFPDNCNIKGEKLYNLFLETSKLNDKEKYIAVFKTGESIFS